MATAAEHQAELTRIRNGVTNALIELANKGVTVPSGAGVDDLATLIAEMDADNAKIYTELVAFNTAPTNYTLQHNLGKIPTFGCILFLLDGIVPLSGTIIGYTAYSQNGELYAIRAVLGSNTNIITTMNSETLYTGTYSSVSYASYHKATANTVSVIFNPSTVALASAGRYLLLVGYLL